MFALDLLNQFQSYNGTLLAAGKIYVYNLGRTQLATVYGDHNGATPIANPVVLDDQGMAEIYLNDAFNYTIVVYDAYGQEQFSRDIYPKGMGNGESIGTQLYEGVDPIVVNNDLYAISANTTKLGVQEPLYFVQDDAERVVIGYSGEEIPAGTMNESALGYQDGKITGYNGSAFSAGNTYEEGSYISIVGNTIGVTGLTPVPADTASTGMVASVSADIIGMIPDTSDMATQTWVNEQGFLTAHQDLSAYAKTEDLTAYQEKGNYYSASNPSGFINSDAISAMATTGFVAGVSADITAMIPDTSDMATKTWVSSQGYLTAHQSLDGLMSADLLEISDNKITGYNGTAFAGQGGGVTGDYELSAGSGISIVDYPLEQKTVISVTAQGGNPEVEQAVIDNSATWNTVGDKLDTTAFSMVSGDFLTALPQDLVYTADIADMATTGDLTGKQDITGMTAYATVESLTAKQDAGEYLSASDSANFLLTSVSGNFYTTANESGFITGVDLTPYQTIEGMTAYQPVGSYLTTADSANFYTTANESGFISEVPTGTMNESAFEYDANDKISGYNGSAFAGDEQVQSDWTESAVNSPAYILNKPTEKDLIAGANVTITESNDYVTIETTEIASGLQLVAGPGVTLTVSGTNVEAAADETVLFETTATNGVGICNLSESLKHFEKIRVLATRGWPGPATIDNTVGGFPGPWSEWETEGISADGRDYNAISPFIFEANNWKNSVYTANDTYTTLTWKKGIQKDMASTAAGSTANSFTACVGIKKIVGVNRVS